MHIDPAPEEQEIPVIEEPKTRNPSRNKKNTRRPHPISPPRKLTLARKVWSSFSAHVLAVEPVIIRSDRSHAMAMGRHRWA
ncbi:hypothetical protein U9M48_039410 [Paspalum notatum var. saurae]|uniref:Uncharacterized protein n=1 Tax=Paspalum notatum var. saurae TaxID=547442 RepID=A0AAQ3XEK8_PASNO